MTRLSAGLLVFRRTADEVVEVLISHPGGPLWAKKDLAAWSIPKGEYGEDEDPAEAADREFSEEIGKPAPPGARRDLGELRQPGGKRVRVWAVEGDLDVSSIRSNTFEMQWPPGSRRMIRFPEIDRAAWVTLDVAREKLHRGQVGFIDRLDELLRHHV
ncbi:MAG TPA: NUDIX domain-containing protein [Acidimicrobiales bacterium]|nr:NUDIX domain-containing protein [Acidimicrobiales bacterium]